MNRRLHPLALALSLIGMSGAALAQVKYLDVRSGGGIYINEGRVVVNPVNGKHTQISTPEISYHLEMKAGCSQDFAKAHGLLDSRVTFGDAYANGHSRTPDAPYTSVPHGYDGEIDWTEVVLKVPVASAKGALSPAAICQAWVDERLSQGATLQQVLSQDKTIVKPVTLSGVALCGRWMDRENAQWKTKTMSHQLTVVCKAGSVGGTGGVQAKPPAPTPTSPGNLTKNLAVVASSLKALTSNYTGQCPAKLPFQAEIQADAMGEVNYQINFPPNAGTQAQVRTGTLVFDGPGTKKTPIFEFMAQTGYPVGVASLVIEQAGQNKAFENFKVQCIQAPVAGGSVLLAPSGPKPPLTQKITPMPPSPPSPPRATKTAPPQPPQPPVRPPLTLQATPVAPPVAPARTIQAAPPPPPAPSLTRQSIPAEPPPPPARAIRPQRATLVR
jgi:hypothetical protein